MTDWEAKRKRESDRIKKALQASGEALLGMIGDELGRQTSDLSVVVCMEGVYIKDPRPAIWEKKKPVSALRLGYVDIPLQITQYWPRGRLSLPREQLNVEVGRITDGQTFETVFKKRTFRTGKGRDASYGYDLKKIAEHCIRWHEALLEQCRKERERAEEKLRRKEIYDQWGVVMERLRAEFDVPEGVKHTERGILFSDITLDERRARAVLEALAKENLR